MRRAPRHLGVGLDVLAGHRGQQRRRVGLFVCELEARRLSEHRAGVCDQLVYEPGPLPGVRPVTRRLGPQAIVEHQLQARRLSDQPPTTPYLRGDHRVGVLRRHRVIQHRGVQRPPPAPRQRPAGPRQIPHRVKDPLRAAADAQPVPPQRQHAVMEPRIVHRQARSGLPAQITPQPLNSLTVRAPLQRLQHQHRRHHRTRHRRPAPTPEQVSEQPVGKQPQTVLGQKPVNRPHPHQTPAQAQHVQQLPIRLLSTLHTYNSRTPAHTNASTPNRITQQSPR